jgi:hypothetical protein
MVEWLLNYESERILKEAITAQLTNYPSISQKGLTKTTKIPLSVAGLPTDILIECKSRVGSVWISYCRLQYFISKNTERISTKFSISEWDVY